MLIEHGASINITDDEGDTPVHWAARWNKTEAIAMLIKHGASINMTNDMGYKPFDWASRHKSEAAVGMLEQL